MHRDKKLGLALGILLVGIVAAFFFRNEPRPDTDLPRLEDAQALDEAIEEKPIAPYLPDEQPSELGEATESLAAFDGTPASQASSSSAGDAADSLIDDDWSFLQDGDENDLLAQADPGPPDPIRQHEIPPAPADVQIDDLNAGWQISDDFPRPGTPRQTSGSSSRTSDMYRNNRPSTRSVSQSRSVGTAETRDSSRADDSLFSQASQTSRRGAGSGIVEVESVSRSTTSRSTSSDSIAGTRSTTRPANTAVTDTTTRRSFRVKEYRVQAGDTLTGLSSRFLGTHKRFHELYEANRDRMKSPDDLQAGMLIRIPESVARVEPAPTAFEQSEARTTSTGSTGVDEIDSALSRNSAVGRNAEDSESTTDHSSALQKLDELSGSDDDLLDGSTSYRPQTFREETAAGRGSAWTDEPAAEKKSEAADRDDEQRTPFGVDEDLEESIPAGPIADADLLPESAGETFDRGESTNLGEATSPIDVAGEMTARQQPETARRGVEARSVSVNRTTSQPPAARTTENPYGLYLIEPVETAEDEPEPQPTAPARSAQSPPVSDRAELRQKFVPARSPLANRRPAASRAIPKPEPETTPAARQPAEEAAPETTLRQGTWVIRRGDTLEGIAVKVYGRRSAATRIFEANRDQLRNPNLLQPGMELRLPVPIR